MKNTRRILGKHGLVVYGGGEKELAAQFFSYDHMREVRAKLDTFEVVVLMDYDQSYHRVFKVEVNEKVTAEMATKLTQDFYTKLLDASLRFTAEEVEAMAKNRAAAVQAAKDALEKAQEPQNEGEVDVESTEEEKEN